MTKKRTQYQHLRRRARQILPGEARAMQRMIDEGGFTLEEFSADDRRLMAGEMPRSLVIQFAAKVRRGVYEPVLPRLWNPGDKPPLGHRRWAKSTNLSPRLMTHADDRD